MFATDDPNPEEEDWDLVAWMTFAFPKGANVTSAELEACRCAVHFVEVYSKAMSLEELSRFCWEWKPQFPECT